MRPSTYRRQWKQSGKQGASAEAAAQLAHRIALSFLDHYYYNARFDAEYIRLLCEMAACYGEGPGGRAVARALFGSIVEALCDDFEELQSDAYNRVMSAIVAFCRKLPTCAELDRRLRDDGLETEEDIYARATALRAGAFAPREEENIEKVFVLSRVTIGADIAITSVIAQRLMARFPGARIFLLGGAKLQELFGGCRGIKLAPLSYPRSGTLLGRINVWRDAADTLDRIAGDTPAERMLVVDTDSRITQLGLLPLGELDRTLFFDSRTDAPETRLFSMCALANHWLDAVLGPSEFAYPRLWLHDETRQAAARFAASLRSRGCRRIVSVNLGAGGNARKTIPGDFPARLANALLRTPNTVMLFDKGGSEQEHRAAAELVRAVSEGGHVVREVAFDGLDESAAVGSGLIAVESGIGEAAALIGESDEFIGYDSACQHIAAALGVPAHIVFAGSNRPIFVRRWRGHGRAPQRIVHVDTISHPDEVDADEVIARLLDWREG